MTGGEPLVREDFHDVIKELEKYNFKIFLDTNGDLFFKYSDLITKCVHVVGLPIDFPNSSYRNKDNFRTILKILDYYKKLKRRSIIRIGTVVTKDNFRQLNKIGNLLKDYPIDIWKIYQFTPQNRNAIKNKSLLEIPESDFDRVSRDAKDNFSNYFKVTISKRQNRNNAYFFINSDGMVFMPVDDMDICKEKRIGNIFDEGILNKWEKFISEKNYINNAKLTFDYKF